MRRLILTALVISSASLAFAQQAPMLVVGGDDNAPASEQAQRAQIEQFPTWAITTVGANTMGQNNDIPSAPAAPQSPSTAEAGADAPAAPTVDAPKPPKNPVTQAWPYDTVPIFMQACVGYHAELTAPCYCVVSKLVNTMPHDEFLQLSAAGTIEDDARLVDIRSQCAAQPRPRK